MLLSAFKQSHADISQSYPRMIRKSKVAAALNMNLSDLNHQRSFFCSTTFKPSLGTIQTLFGEFAIDNGSVFVVPL